VFKRGRRQSFFSVVIASYNSAAWIKHTIRSVLEQTYRNFEVIVVGDGCTDGTEELLKTKFGKRIRWKNLPSNSGSQSAPNNEGIRVAHGSHIAYLGHDDIWSRYHLELLDGVVREQDPDFAVSGAVYHGPPGSMFYQIAGIFDDPDMVRREFFPPSSFAHKRAAPASRLRVSVARGGPCVPLCIDENDLRSQIRGWSPLSFLPLPARRRTETPATAPAGVRWRRNGVDRDHRGFG
jgi:glycosyltransferase involved in cell wall biosynthesis